MTGCNFDITLFNALTTPRKISAGQYLRPADYEVEKVMRNMPYLLNNGIYPMNPLFFYSVANPCTEKKSYFAVRRD